MTSAAKARCDSAINWAAERAFRFTHAGGFEPLAAVAIGPLKHLNSRFSVAVDAGI